MPTILERNGIIKSYNFEYFETTVRWLSCDLLQKKNNYLILKGQMVHH
jgi:hypothetical protein